MNLDILRDSSLPLPIVRRFSHLVGAWQGDGVKPSTPTRQQRRGARAAGLDPAALNAEIARQNILAHATQTPHV